MPPTDDSKDVFNEIKNALEQNGNLEQSTRDRLMLMAIVCVYNEVKAIKRARQDVLEKIVYSAIGAFITLLITYIFVRVFGGAL